MKGNVKSKNKIIVFLLIVLITFSVLTGKSFATYFASSIGTVNNDLNGEDLVTTTDLINTSSYYYRTLRLFSK